MRRFLMTVSLILLMASAALAQVNVAPMPPAKYQFFDAAAKPLAFGIICTYSAGTNSPLATYTDSTGTVTNSVCPNPMPTPPVGGIILDSGGFANIWLGPASYKIVVQNSARAVLWTVDGVRGLRNLLEAIDASYAAPIRGSIITAQGVTPLWTRLVKGNQYLPLTMGASEPGWIALSLDQPTATSGILDSAKGGTGNGFTEFSGPTTPKKTFTLPNVSSTILTTDGPSWDGARVYNSAVLTIPTGSFTALTFDSERYDNGGLHESVTHPSRLTAQRAGVYMITALAEFSANVTGLRLARIRVSGGTQIWALVNTSTSDILTAALLYKLAAGEYIEFEVYQSSGGDLTVVASGNYTPEFAMQWMGS